MHSLWIDCLNDGAGSCAKSAGGKSMWDAGCIVASVLFFVIAIAYAMGCDRLGTKEAHR